jgi:hypothetical protein
MLLSALKQATTTSILILLMYHLSSLSHSTLLYSLSSWESVVIKAGLLEFVDLLSCLVVEDNCCWMPWNRRQLPSLFFSCIIWWRTLIQLGQCHYRGHETKNRLIIFTNVMTTYFKILTKSAYEFFQTHREFNISLHIYFPGEESANIIRVRHGVLTVE